MICEDITDEEPDKSTLTPLEPCFKEYFKERPSQNVGLVPSEIPSIEYDKF
jgi:hypothetical protein